MEIDVSRTGNQVTRVRPFGHRDRSLDSSALQTSSRTLVVAAQLLERDLPPLAPRPEQGRSSAVQA